MKVSYRPSNSTDVGELKQYVEEMLREYADQINSVRIEQTPTVSAEPNPTYEGMTVINNPLGWDIGGDGSTGKWSFIGGIWVRQDNPDNTVVINDIPTENDIIIYNGSEWVVKELIIPTGAVFAFATDVEQPDHLICDGRTLLRINYQDLFDVIGTTWGSTTPLNFSIPDLRERLLVGSNGVNTGLEENVGTKNNGINDQTRVSWQIRI